jgi:hypothetical protein
MSALNQTTTGDLDISTGNLVVNQSISQTTAWKLSNLFGFFKGEWFLDQRQGVPYFQYVMVSNPNLNLIGNIFRAVCMSAPGVASVSDVQLDFTPRTRSLIATIQAQTNEGATLTGGIGTPFVITQPVGSSA